MEFKEAVREYCIQEGRRIWFKKNDNVRMRAVCKDASCGWLVYASNNTENNCWQIKTFMDNHTCARETKNRLANRKWLAYKLVKKLRKYPNLRHSEATQYFKTKCDLELNKSSLTRALGDARSVVYGDAAAQYGTVRDYGLTLLKSNPGSTVTVRVIPQPNPDDDPIFEKMYVCLEGCKKGFLASCRPLIGLDGAFLKTRHGGQILSAIGQDANNHIYVIAYAIVPVENTENWRWFLELLHQDLGDYKKNKLCFISDMQKLRRFFQMSITDSAFDICGRTSTSNRRISSLEGFSGIVQGVLAKMASLISSKRLKGIKDARAKPIITLLEEVRMYAMRLIARNKVKLNSNTGVLPPI
ncbi:uncharacterized protein LOC107637147 [Arachis ipaensis]|uniref:uncharacterized protein LOC107637147 n=1 Tax=Arachis ipaensis TaxID=130454 RepID=UPI0007AF57CD|nr:uncharacterized protein LOC107637147 [Arachis ipaensis]XP_025648189.1 uncharacterized protein LOC112743199 [Arachis hypogaea]